MKKWLCSVIVLIIFLSTGSIASAKSFEIERVHIKSWIQPNGELMVNEIFSYNLDGSFTSLSRSFPEEHMDQVNGFEAYLLKKPDAEPGFIDDVDLVQLPVSIEGGTYRTEIQATDRNYTVLYFYRMKNAVHSNKNYSEINVTYFDTNSAHDQNFSNVTIDFILPEKVNPKSFEGFLFDRNGKPNGKNEYGIRFFTPLSEAYTDTKISFFFPSSVMTEQAKGDTDISYRDAIQSKQDELTAMQKRLAMNDQLSDHVLIACVVLLVLSGLLLVILPQRHVWRRGSAQDVLLTDPLYLFFVDKEGRPQRKAFLAGLFSMVEAGAVEVRTKKAALRFQDDPKIAQETLAFRLVNGSKTQQPHEIKMIQWLFSLKAGSSKWTFHLHDAAGAARKEKNAGAKQHFHEKVKRFKKKDREWYRTVIEELKEAGTLNGWIPSILISFASIALTVYTAVAFYADLRSALGIAWVIGIGIAFLILYWLKRWRKRVVFSYGILMLVTISNIVNAEVMTASVLFLLAFIIFYFAVPMYILSMGAVRAKDAIRAFKREIRKGPPETLSDEENEKWLTRAYLLSRKSTDIPLNESRQTTSPLHSALSVGPDPLSVLAMTWFWTKGASSGGGSSSDSGGWSGDSGGGSDGGGAGAD